MLFPRSAREDVEMEGNVGKLPTVADSAGVGIRLLRYLCNGTKNAVVR